MKIISTGAPVVKTSSGDNFQEEEVVDWKAINEILRQAKEKENFGDKKSVYLSLANRERTRPPEWVYLNPHFGKDGLEFYRHRIYHMKYPEWLTRLRRFGCAVCDNEIYFIGGKSRDDPFSEDYSPKVSIYDVKSREWSKGVPLNIARASPMVAVIGRKIYVFGGYINRRNAYPDFSKKKEWAEYLDLDDADPEWKFLADNVPDGAFAVRPQAVHFHAVYERRNQILFWFHTEYRAKANDPPKVALFAYDYISEKWVDPPSVGESGPISTHTPIIVGDVLIWHYFGKIFGYHLVTNKSLMFEIPNSPFGEPFFVGHVPERTFLVPVGGSKLCLIWYEPPSDEGKQIYCYRFEVKTNSESEAGDCDFVGIEFESVEHFPTSASGVSYALPVSLMYR